MRIYAITNTLSGQQYVGSTRMDLDRRFYAHAHSTALLIGREMAAVGIDYFSISLLEEVESDTDRDLESFWIAKLGTLIPNGYNAIMPSTSAKRAAKKLRVLEALQQQEAGRASAPDEKRAYAFRLSNSQIKTLEKGMATAGFAGKRNEYIIHLLSL